MEINLIPEIKTLLASMVPVTELRVALPVALLSYKMSIVPAYVLSVIGNIIPVFLLLLFWKYFVKFLMQNSKTCEKFFNWLFERTRKKFEGKYNKWGKLALILFVAIPLPVTGAWTGSVAAWLFNFKYWESIGLIFLGICISGVIVSLLSLGGGAIF
ncbi:small multi-drug export protein [Candidatus Parcubacteria bacterium]|nr:small multi-drug export protein [Patescibacteria group bacterium]MCG2686683.1 small multi-drug export protein [Candidatus Parcubacteria bacterium]